MKIPEIGDSVYKPSPTDENNIIRVGTIEAFYESVELKEAVIPMPSPQHISVTELVWLEALSGWLWSEGK